MTRSSAPPTGAHPSPPAAEIVERGIAALGREGGFVVVSTQSSANVRWANSMLTTNGLATEQQVSVVAFRGDGQSGAAGICSGVLDSRDPIRSLVELVAGAQAGAEAAEPAEDYSAPYSPAGDDPQPCQGWDEPAASVAPADLGAVTDYLAPLLSPAAVRDGRSPGAGGLEHFGYAEQSVTTMHLGTSTGVRARLCTPRARFELSGKSHNRTRSAWTGRSGTWLAGLTLDGCAEEIRAGLGRQGHRVDVQPGRHPVVLSASAAADMLIYLLWSSSARDALDGRSALRRPGGGAGTAIGIRVCPLPLSMGSDPRAPGLPAANRVVAVGSGPLSSTFDTGMPIPATKWIDNGTVAALATTRQSARRGGLPDTPIADNLLVTIDGRTGRIDELASRVGDGLLVTCLWYIREVDAPTLLLTGLTRDGVYVVRGGEIVGASGNFRYNESPLGMLGRLADAGAPQRCLPREWGDYFTMTEVAPLAIADFNLSTPSDAV